jgi:hypothetical protein
MSHGAIVEHTPLANAGAGHIVIKAVQLLMEAIKRHMTSEGAYFRHLAAHGDQFHDWMSAEQDTYVKLF